jgi:hypothetical protein
MSLPSKGTRRIVVEQTAYRWCVRYDGLHWHEGYPTTLDFIVQDAEGAGQVLTAWLCTSRREWPGRHAGPFAPRFVRGLILVGLSAGWQPAAQGLGTFALEGRIEPPAVRRPGPLAPLARGCRVDFISRDAATGERWLNLTCEGDWSEHDEDFPDLEVRVTNGIAWALGSTQGVPGAGPELRLAGLRLLCLHPPAPAAGEVLARLRDVCAAYDLGFAVSALGAAGRWPPVRS